MAKSRSNSGPQGSVGLDLDGDFLSAVTVADGRIQSAVSTDLPEGVMHDGEVVDSDALGHVLKEIFRTALCRATCASELPTSRSSSASSSCRVSRRRKDLEAAVRFQAAEAIAMPLNEVVLDYHRVGDGIDADGNPRTNVVVVAARESMIERLVEAVRVRRPPAGRHRPERLRARARPGLRRSNDDSARVYCHLGAITNLAIAVGPNCLFTRPLATRAGRRPASSTASPSPRRSAFRSTSISRSRRPGPYARSCCPGRAHRPTGSPSSLLPRPASRSSSPSRSAPTTAPRCRPARILAATQWRSGSPSARWRHEARQPSSRAVPPAHRRVGRLEDRVHRARRPRALVLAVFVYVSAANKVSAHNRTSPRLVSRSSAAQSQSVTLQGFGDFAGIKEARLSAVKTLATARIDWERLFRELAHVLPAACLADWLQLAGRRRRTAAARSVPTAHAEGVRRQPRADRRRDGPPARAARGRGRRAHTDAGQRGREGAAHRVRRTGRGPAVRGQRLRQLLLVRDRRSRCRRRASPAPRPQRRCRRGLEVEDEHQRARQEDRDDHRPAGSRARRTGSFCSRPKREAADRVPPRRSRRSRRALADAQAHASTVRSAPRTSFARDYAAVVALGKAIPTSVDMPSLLVQLEQAAHGTGIELDGITMGERAPVAEPAPAPAPVPRRRTAPSGEPPQSAPGRRCRRTRRPTADTARHPAHRRPTAPRRRRPIRLQPRGPAGAAPAAGASRVRLDGVQASGRLLRACRLLPPAEALRLRGRRQGAGARSPDDDRQRRVHRRARHLPGPRGHGQGDRLPHAEVRGRHRRRDARRPCDARSGAADFYRQHRRFRPRPRPQPPRHEAT